MLKFFSLILLLSFVNYGAKAQEQEWSIGKVKARQNYGRGVLDVLPNESQWESDEILSAHAISNIDLLRQEPSLNIQGGGVPGLVSTVFLRGASSDHTLLMWNGLEQNDISAPGAGGDLAFLNREFSHELRILKGPQSLLYGSSALGGVILYDRQASVPSQLKMAIGSLESGELLVEKQVQRSDQEFAIGGRVFQINGLSATQGGAGSSEKDRRREASFSGLFKKQFAANLQIEALAASAENFSEDDVPPRDDPNAWTQQKQNSIRLSAYHSWATDWQSDWHLSRVALQRQSLNEPDTSSSSSYQDNSQGNFVELRNLNRLKGSSLITQFGFVLRQENVDFTGLSRAEEKQAVFVLQELSGSEFDLAYGLRDDCVAGAACQLVGQMLMQKHFLSLGLSPFLSAASGLKRPTIYQKYATGSGNVDLKSEQALNLESGIQWRQGLHQEMKASVFDTIYSELIDYDLGLSRYFNLSRARIQGLEFDYRQRQDPWHWGLGYAYLVPRDEVQQQDLLRRARHKFNALLGLNVNETWVIRLETAFQGPREDLVNLSRVPMAENWTWNGVFTHQLKKSNVSFRVNNLANGDMDYAIGYPAPRVNFWFEYQQEL